MKTDVLRMLKENDGYLSGQELCERFHVSRTAVWKVMKQLEAEGYEIEAVRNKGYRLKMAGDILSRAELMSSISTEWAGSDVLYFDETDSTNTEIKKAAEKGALHGTLAVADYQFMGKGRRGRSWTSPHGVGIWMSILLRPQLHPSCASMLTLVSALAVADGIEEVCGLDTKIKWPNDIVVNGKKVCGILTEMSTELECINYVVVGIGINANTLEFPEDIKAVATSLLLETGVRVNRSRLIGAVMKAMEKYYALFLEHQDMSGLLKVYNEKLANKDNVVRVLAPGNEYTGTAEGINAAGELLVRMEDGELRTVISGEVSVRGIYGYV
ncbi:MAG: biotin--[acetyl-CoA-carboxylase] ligase [Clostridium sp.]|nr:biotin--[acetyl-CoA-carboxylase] ligase [Clostridium sp.]